MSDYRPKPPDEIARNMSAIRSTGNETETALRKAVHAMGFRYRKYYPGLFQGESKNGEQGVVAWDTQVS